MSKQTTPYERAIDFIKQMDGEDRRPAWRTDNDILCHALLAFSDQQASLTPVPVVQWEYTKILMYNLSVRELDELGKEGWELAAYHSDPAQYIFKRPLKHQ